MGSPWLLWSLLQSLPLLSLLQHTEPPPHPETSPLALSAIVSMGRDDEQIGCVRVNNSLERILPHEALVHQLNFKAFLSPGHAYVDKHEGCFYRA